MKIKFDAKRLAVISYNVIVTSIVSEIVNESIKAVKNKIKDIKRKEEAQ